MKIGAPKEVFPGEARVAMTPDSALALQKLGHTCFVEAGAGARAGISDAAYAAAGVGIVPDAAALFAATDVITKVRPPTEVGINAEKAFTAIGGEVENLQVRLANPDFSPFLQKAAKEGSHREAYQRCWCINPSGVKRRTDSEV